MDLHMIKEDCVAPERYAHTHPLSLTALLVRDWRQGEGGWATRSVFRPNTRLAPFDIKRGSKAPSYGVNCLDKLACASCISGTAGIQHAHCWSEQTAVPRDRQAPERPALDGEFGEVVFVPHVFVARFGSHPSGPLELNSWSPGLGVQLHPRAAAFETEFHARGEPKH
eukprot:351389-Chlamydomonas_euryale.AAC.1